MTMNLIELDGVLRSAPPHFGLECGAWNESRRACHALGLVPGRATLPGMEPGLAWLDGEIVAVVGTGYSARYCEVDFN